MRSRPSSTSRATTRPGSSIGQAHYSALPTPQGTFVDDVLTYKLTDEHFMLVVNASNIIKDFNWITTQIAGIGDAVAVNTSSRYALIALQGPAARDVLQTLTGVNLGDIKYYWFTTGEVAGVRVTISRTGYTGEDGFEVFVPPASAERVWDAILLAGKSAGVVPAGLGARDTLRLEAAMRLYGNDIDDTTTVLEADLGWTVGWKKEEFIGPDVLRRQKQEGVARKLVGFEVLDRAIARHGYDVYVDGQKAGVVTSGTQTPFLKKSDRHGLRAERSHRRRDRVRNRRPRPPRARAGRADAVLQASGHHRRKSPLAQRSADRASAKHAYVSRRFQVHERSRVGRSSPAATRAWASPTTRRSSSATSCTSSCRRSAGS